MPHTSCRGPRTPALSTYALPIAATAHAPLRRQGGGGEWAGRLFPGPIGSEEPRPPGRWTELDPGGGRRRRGQPCGRGGGGAQGLEAGPGAVSPAPAAAAAAAVPYMSWPRWLPALPTAVRRPGIPSRLPPCWPGAQEAWGQMMAGPGWQDLNGGSRSSQHRGKSGLKGNLKIAWHFREGLA
ncbi:translation initiation factor IF-2-like [Physeter macrocephalus]|uniref:Translation initiation factor IF-2-like n=1 Tax=Physeter macrocephalus TaxID=9755 RepID=A0A9W2WGB9_PHYMC|nr:translation initiation factor IF-2-like [Physeter catodon]